MGNDVTGNGVTGNDITENDVTGNGVTENGVTWSGIRGIKSVIRGVSYKIRRRHHYVFSLSLFLHLTSYTFSLLPTHRVLFYVPAFTYARIRLQIEIEIGLEFNQSEESKSIFTLVNFALID